MNKINTYETLPRLVSEYFKETVGEAPNAHLVRKIRDQEIKRDPEVDPFNLFEFVLRRLINEYGYYIPSESLADQNNLRPYLLHPKYKPQRQGD
jgi:hypothetical protein